MPMLDFDDIQGLVLRGHGKLDAAAYVLVAFTDPAGASRWLRTLTGQVTDAGGRPTQQAVQVGLTAHGLATLGLPAATLDQFPVEFTEGMAAAHRSRVLGDVGDQSPQRWDWGGPTNPDVDGVLLLYARDAAELERLHARYAHELATNGGRELARLDTSGLSEFEHFGFRDSISQPTVEGTDAAAASGDVVRAGEFLLGYRNEYGLYTRRPLLPLDQDPHGLLPADESGSGLRDLGRNGSYVVFRQLEQDVAAFWRYVDAAARRPDGSPDPQRRVWLAAKMIGRWPGGAPLVLAPDADDLGLSYANDFAYHHADPLGHACPLGAHIRRAHPRDSLDPRPGTPDSVAVGRRHRILRRGRRYGDPLPVDRALRAEGGADDNRCGLHFLAVNANIARQFEFLQQTWLVNPHFNGLYDDGDPLIRSGTSAGSTFTIQASPVRQRFPAVPRFVTARGGAYFFLPGLRALRFLAGVENAR